MMYFFNWIHFGGSDTRKHSITGYRATFAHHHHYYHRCHVVWCVHACCRFSMFHHIIYIISLHTHIYQFLQFHSHVMVDSCVSALLLLQTKVKIYIIHTANTIHRDSCMNFALSTNLRPPEYSTILSDASLSCSFFTLCIVISIAQAERG